MTSPVGGVRGQGNEAEPSEGAEAGGGQGAGAKSAGFKRLVSADGLGRCH